MKDKIVNMWQELRNRETWGETETELTYKNLGKFIGLYFVALFFLIVLSMILFPEIETDNIYFAFFADTVVWLAILLFIYKPDKLFLDFKIFSGLSWKVLRNALLIGIGADIIIGLIGSAFLALLVYSGVDIMPQHVADYFADPKNAANLPLMAIQTVIFTPITEEIFFRGILMRTIAKKRSVVSAIIISSVIFALIHFDFHYIPFLLLAGLLFGTIYAVTDNLWYPIIIHTVINFTAVISFISY